jgi:hypothetical protein
MLRSLKKCAIKLGSKRVSALSSPQLVNSLVKTQHPSLNTTTKMLPPIEDSVLQSNPKFAALHATLANNILNANGSTKHHPAQKERDAVTEVQSPLFSTHTSLTTGRPSKPLESTQRSPISSARH